MKSILIFFLVCSIHVDGGKIDNMEKKIEKILEKQDILKESIKELKVCIYNSIKVNHFSEGPFLYVSIL